jgi:hypothetical protein
VSAYSTFFDLLQNLQSLPFFHAQFDSLRSQSLFPAWMKPDISILHKPDILILLRQKLLVHLTPDNAVVRIALN